MTTIQHRRGTAVQWTTANRVLASGEIGVETDTGNVKVGDGTTAWNALPYITAGGGGGDGSYSASDTTESMRIIVFSNGNVMAVPFAAVPPETPTGLTGSALVASVSLTWASAARAAQYRVYRNSVVIATVSSPFYGDYAVTAGQTYTYKIQAVDQYGQMSGISSGFDATPDPSLNVAPTIEVRTWPAELPEGGVVLVRANVNDVDAQSLAVQFGVSDGSITPTTDPSLWLLTL